MIAQYFFLADCFSSFFSLYLSAEDMLSGVIGGNNGGSRKNSIDMQKQDASPAFFVSILLIEDNERPRHHAPYCRQDSRPMILSLLEIPGSDLWSRSHFAGSVVLPFPHRSFGGAPRVPRSPF